MGGSNNDDDERYATTMKNSNELSDIIKDEFKKLMDYHNNEASLFINRKNGKSLKNINIFNLILFCP